MSFFVTGAAGCVGLAVVERLLEQGAAVLGVDLIDLPQSAKRHFVSLPGTLDFRIADLRAPEVSDALKQLSSAPRIIHCAVMTPNIGAERSLARTVVTSNIDTTAAMLDIAREYGAQHLLHVSSGGVYGDLRGRTDLRDGLVSETETRMEAKSLYALSKAASEGIVHRYRELFDLPVQIARVALTFGPWERYTGARSLVSAPHQILAHARAGRPIRLERNSTRGWTSSRDVADALVRLSELGRTDPDIINVATQHRWPLSRFLEALRERMPDLRVEEPATAGGGAAPNVWLHFNFDAPNLDITRLLSQVGAESMMSPDAAIDDHLDWADAFWGPEFDRLA